MEDKVIKILVDSSAFKRIELRTSVTGEECSIYTFEKTPGAENRSLEWELVNSMRLTKSFLRKLSIAHVKLQEELNAED